MQRERPHQNPPERTAGGPPDGDDVDRVREETEEMLAAADHMLDSIHVSDAEGYLQDNRQRGGE